MLNIQCLFVQGYELISFLTLNCQVLFGVLKSNPEVELWLESVSEIWDVKLH